MLRYRWVPRRKAYFATACLCLRREWNRLRDAARTIPPKNIPAVDAVERVWLRIEDSAREQGRSVFAISSLMAVSTVAHLPANMLRLSRAAALRTSQMLGANILDHYTEALARLSETGFADFWAAEFRPYLRGAAEQFAANRQSSTEKLLRRISHE